MRTALRVHLLLALLLSACAGNADPPPSVEPSAPHVVAVSAASRPGPSAVSSAGPSALAAASPAVSSSAAVEPVTVRRVILRGIVTDYSNRVVADARVSASDGDRSVTTQTDIDGRFAIAVRPGAHVSATKHDMLGSIKAGSEAEQTVVIKMAQMPM